MRRNRHEIDAMGGDARRADKQAFDAFGASLIRRDGGVTIRIMSTRGGVHFARELRWRLNIGDPDAYLLIAVAAI